jgi:uncharacterized protein YebE (UPF0316 family)
MEAILTSDLYGLVILPVLIFLARVIDVSIGTIRVIFISRGYKILAPILGFVEILVWLLAMAQIMNNLTSIYYYLAYAAGFSAGTYVGIWIEEKLCIGLVILRVITKTDASDLIEYLKDKGLGVTTLDGEGSEGKVKVFLTILRRKQLRAITDAIKEYNPNAFYSVEDVRFVNEGIFPKKQKKNYKYLLKYYKEKNMELLKNQRNNNMTKLKNAFRKRK